MNSGDRQIARGASVVMAGLALSSLAGLVTTMLVSRAFGTQADLDAFYAANRLPELLFLLMAGGALASAFVPAFTGFLTRAIRLSPSSGHAVHDETGRSRSHHDLGDDSTEIGISSRRPGSGQWFDQRPPS